MDALGCMRDRTHRELSPDDIAQIAGAYHAWRGEEGAGDYADLPGFCKSTTLEEIKGHGFVLTPGRYVGAAAVAAESEPFEDRMARLVATLEEQFAEGARLEVAIRENLQGLGYGQ